MKRISYLLAGFISLVASLFGMTALGNSPSVYNPDNNDSMTTPPEKNDSIRPSYSSADIQQMLQKLSKTPIKDDLKIGAMCYSRVMPSDTSAYICPVCGEKTIYGEYDEAVLRLEVPRCRSMVSLLPNTLSLDERSFCKHCDPDPKRGPEMCLIVKLTDQEEHITCGVRENSLEMLLTFFRGETVRMGDTGGEIPLQDEISKIEYLLGVKLE